MKKRVSFMQDTLCYNYPDTHTDMFLKKNDDDT